MPEITPTPLHAVGAPARSQAQRINDLTRERDRLAKDLIGVRALLGRVRNAVFNLDTSPCHAEVAELKRLFLDNWEAATPPGRCFDMMRATDESKVSGTGRVAEGFEFENGKVALCWLGKFSSVNVYDSIDHVRAIHGHGGSTQIVYREKERNQK